MDMDNYQTRREAVADTFEQSKDYQAMQTLLDLGVCKKVSDLKLYHGRAGNGNEWEVNPSYNNAGNNTGNHNINKIPALNTGERDIANSFAEARVDSRNTIPEIHRIVSDDPDAMVVDPSRIDQLKGQSEKSALEALATLSPGVMSGAPITVASSKFKDRDELMKGVRPGDFKNEYGIMLQNDMPRIVEDTGLTKEQVKQIGSAINTKVLIENGFFAKLCRLFTDTNDTTIPVKMGDNKTKVPFSREYLSNWFRSAHIVGRLSRVSSATLGKDIDACLFFDLEKVKTEEAMENHVKNRNRYFGEIALAMYEKNEKTTSSLLDTLNSDLYIKPEEIIRIAKKTPGFKDVFNADAGNWEGFKLSEHTETVLRLFDHNFVEIMPASSIPIIRLALLVHDIGKPEAAKNDDKGNQKQYNKASAKRFMELNKVDDATSELVLSMIGEGLELTSKLIANRGNKETKKEILAFCEKIAGQYLGTEQIDRDTITGFRLILEILQTCDSGAYTAMAVTRASNGARFRNPNSFGSSFADYPGFTGNRVRLLGF